MITIPSVLLHGNIAVYPDDEDCNLFYCIKTTPEIRMVDGQPVFSGLFWTDKADGSMNSVAGLAGGWINFDSNLSISEKEEKEIIKKIEDSGVQDKRRKELVKAENERLRLIAKASGEEKDAEEVIPVVGKVRFGAINFTEGTVTLLEEKAGGDIVEWSSAGGPASLIGDNNAAFAMRLSPMGAAIWYKALKEGVKAISIRYELKFLLRLPSLEIRAWAGSFQKIKVERDVKRNWETAQKRLLCPDKKVEKIDVKSITQFLREEGLVNIEIKKGSTEISNEHVSQLREMALNLIESKVEEIIKTRVLGMTPEERQSSMLELIEEEVNSFIELRFKQEDVVEWSIAPQGTIMNFLDTVPAEKRKNVTRLVDLSEHEVETIELNVNVDAPWDEEPFVNMVKVDMTYPTAKQSHSILFKKDTQIETWRFRRPKNDDGRVNYRTSVYFKGISEPLELPEKTTNGHVNINVGKVGLIDVNFIPHQLLLSLSGKNKVNVIQVDLSYKKEGQNDHFTDRVVFTPEDLEGKNFRKITGKIIDAPLCLKVSYFLKGGNIIEMKDMKYYITENQTINITTPYPYNDSLELYVELPLIPDDSVSKVVAEFQYEDEKNGFESSDQVTLSKDDDWESAMAKLVLIDKNFPQFKYRYKIFSKDDIAQSGWMTGSGDAELIVLPITKVSVNISQLGMGANYAGGILTLNYNDGITRDEKEVNLTSNTPETISWYIPKTGNTEAEYTYSLMLYDSKGKTVESTGTNKGKILLLQKPK